MIIKAGSFCSLLVVLLSVAGERNDAATNACILIIPVSCFAHLGKGYNRVITTKRMTIWQQILGIV